MPLVVDFSMYLSCLRLTEFFQIWEMVHFNNSGKFSVIIFSNIDSSTSHYFLPEFVYTQLLNIWKTTQIMNMGLKSTHAYEFLGEVLSLSILC